MKIICVGRNYSDHAKELNNPVPAEPVIFLKPETAKIPGGQPFFIPDFSQEIHHEIEVVYRIGKNGKNIDSKFAYRYVDAITIGIDFTARDIQQKCKEKGLPWELAKSFDHSAPVGLFIDLNQGDVKKNVDFHLEVNGEIRQKGNTSEMLFPVTSIISFVSRYITLKKGDLIFTGTPAGVGPVKKGDVLRAFFNGACLLELPIK